jgi:hypothetical protein
MPTTGGNYDNPSFLVRQQIFLGRTIAGASGTSCQIAFPVSNMRIRAVALNVITAGTTTDTYTVQAGTTSIGQIIIGTGAANTVTTSSDLNTILTNGTTLNIKNGTDATKVVSVTVEAHIDPAAVWTGP